MTSTRAATESAADTRAIHRALTGLRDRLRLQEDELDRLRERVERPIQMPAPAIDQQTLADDIQQNVERNLLPQVRALESQVAEQAGMLHEAFEVMGRTDMNVRRLIAQVDRLLEQVSRRPIDVTSETTGAPPARPRQPVRTRTRERASLFTAVEDLDEDEDSEAPRFRWKIPLLILVVLIAILAAVWDWYRDALPATTAPLESSLMTPIDQARAYESDRNYPKAEAAYRELLSKDPTNAEVIKHLASVLYREDKVDESAEVMKKLPADSTH
jgi:hypothetical protein